MQRGARHQQWARRVGARRDQAAGALELAHELVLARAPAAEGGEVGGAPAAPLEQAGDVAHARRPPGDVGHGRACQQRGVVQAGQHLVLHQRRHDGHTRARQRPRGARDCARIEPPPSRLFHRPAGQEPVVGAVVGRGIRAGGLDHARYVFDRGNPGARRRQGVDLAQMGCHREPECPGFVHQRAEQRRRDPGVDRDVVRAGDGALVDRLAGLGAHCDAGRVLVGRGRAVDQRARREHPRPEDRGQVEIVAQREARIGARVHVAHRGHPPRDVASRRPALDVRVRVDQPGDDRLTGHVYDLRAARHVGLAHAGDGPDVALLDQHQGVRRGRRP